MTSIDCSQSGGLGYDGASIAVGGSIGVTSSVVGGD